MKLALLALLALVAIAIVAPAAAHYQAPGLDQIASTLSGRPVSIRCVPEEEQANDANFAIYGAEAYVEGREDARGRWIPGRVAMFRDLHCTILVRAMARDFDGLLLNDIAWAILALTHESGHLRGARWAGDEAKTQCWAMHHYRAALNLLGLRDQTAHYLVGWQIRQIHKFQLPPQYQLPGCALGTLTPPSG